MKSSIIISIIILTTVSFAQENAVKIYGKVIHKLTKQSLPVANVLVVNANYGSSADANGNFEINNIPVWISNISFNSWL